LKIFLSNRQKTFLSVKRIEGEKIKAKANKNIGQKQTKT
jgi:hypothetical protein